jgi:hypothetical protein
MRLFLPGTSCLVCYFETLGVGVGRCVPCPSPSAEPGSPVYVSRYAWALLARRAEEIGRVCVAHESSVTRFRCKCAESRSTHIDSWERALGADSEG